MILLISKTWLNVPFLSTSPTSLSATSNDPQNYRHSLNIKLRCAKYSRNCSFRDLTCSGNLCSGWRFNMGTEWAASGVSGSSGAAFCSCFTMMEHSLCWRDHRPLSSSEERLTSQTTVKVNWALWNINHARTPPSTTIHIGLSSNVQEKFLYWLSESLFYPVESAIRLISAFIIYKSTPSILGSVKIPQAVSPHPLPWSLLMVWKACLPIKIVFWTREMVGSQKCYTFPPFPLLTALNSFALKQQFILK